jgi:hypothetical protein
LLLAFRFLWLIVFTAGAHLQDGLAYPALAVAFLLGWLRWRIYWLAAPALALAFFAAHIYAHATGEGKTSGAMGNFAFEAMVFGVLGLAGYWAGWLLRRRRLGR